MSAAATVAVVPVMGWIGFGVAGVLVIAAAFRWRWFERLGSVLAGDAKYEREALARTGTAEGAERVAACAAMLAPVDEVRLIRWTPARTSAGIRVVLGASPAAWYLWLPLPSVLLRVPDALVDSVQHTERGNGVVELTCTGRMADAVVTATDGDTVESAADSFELATTLLSGLVIVDPNRRPERTPAAAADPAPLGVAVGLAG